MNTNRIDKKKVTNPMSKLRKNKKSVFVIVLGYFLFGLIFTACTFPFLLLYGPFENAKRTYV